jgi:D-xylonolactonase
MATTQPISVYAVGATLGEGPVWVAADEAVWFVDIKERRLHRFRPDDGLATSWTAPAQPGWILPVQGGGMLVGLQTGLHRFGPATGDFGLVHETEAHLPGNRLNDAVVDARGTLWFGSMDDAEREPSGRLYRFRDGRLHDTGLEPVVITNGPALSPDGGTLYHTDTLRRRIWAVERQDDGTLGTPRLFAEIEHGAGHPDGSTIDAEGCLWIGLFGGWGVRRYAPDGRLIDTVRFPVANVTKIAFGGDRLATAYATTARKGLSPGALRDQPLAGDLFAFEPGVAGVAGHEVALSD